MIARVPTLDGTVLHSEFHVSLVTHGALNASGRVVHDEIQKNLQLSEWHMELSRMTLHRFRNTSSSSLWYEMAYAEAKGQVAKSDRVWQIAFESGFKCNSAVWKVE